MNKVCVLSLHDAEVGDGDDCQGEHEAAEGDEEGGQAAEVGSGVLSLHRGGGARVDPEHRVHAGVRLMQVGRLDAEPPRHRVAQVAGRPLRRQDTETTNKTR